MGEEKQPKKRIRPAKVLLEPRVTKAQWAAVMDYVKFYDALDPNLRIGAKYRKEVKTIRNG